jgi:hypothetical protein
MKELAIQTFLRSGKTLEDLYQRYEIQHNYSSDNQRVVFNYRVLSPMDSKIVQESRALVLEVGTWNVVSKSPEAFFAVEETYAAPTIANFDWSSARAMTKLDGALITFYHYQNEWRVCTRHSTDGDIKNYTINASPSNYTWRQLVEKCIQDMGSDWNTFTSQLNQDIFYTFEITSPENRVVVVYTDRKVTLIAAIARDTLEELDIYEMEFPNLKVPFVKVKDLESAQKLIEKNSDPLSYEGYILIDKYFHRLKLRNPKFLQMLQFYSPQDELTALREIRMMDAGSGYNTGSGGGGTGSHASLSSGITGEIFSTQSLINRMLTLSKYVNDSYAEIADNTDPKILSEHPINKIWPEAVEYRKKGMSMSDILDKSSEGEILEALRKFETNLNK